MKYTFASPLLLAALALGCTTSDAAKPGLKLTPCQVPGAGDALCGTHRVFEDREANSGRTIDLNLVVLPARDKRKRPDPIFFLHGGPGAAASAMAPLFAGSPLRQDRDIVLLDQRGTGKSNPLQCEISGLDELLAAIGTFDLDLEECRDSFDANLRLYTTSIAVDDLDDVRAALGVKKINLYGASYGTRVALEYARRYPDRLRSSVLRGVAPPPLSIPVNFARDSQAALDRVLDDCLADERCGAAYPEVRAELDTVLRRLNESPVTVEVRDPYTNRRVEVSVTPELFAAGLHYALYQGVLAAAIPAVIHDAAAGEYTAQVEQTVQLAQALGGQIYLGMMLSVACTEDEPFFDDEDIERLARGSYLGSLAGNNMKRSCAGWPRGELPEDFKRHVHSNAPTLLISGDADPVTPPRYAAEALESLPNGRHLVLPGIGHSNMTPGCVGGLVRRFVDDPKSKTLDVSCAEDTARPGFVVR